MADIRLILAAILVDHAEGRKIAKVLQEEYGIVAASLAADDQILSVSKAEFANLEVAKAQKVASVQDLKSAEKRKPYVPRIIGKPHGFPKNMRRK